MTPLDMLMIGIFFTFFTCWFTKNYIRYKRQRESWNVIWKGIKFSRKYRALKSLLREGK